MSIRFLSRDEGQSLVLIAGGFAMLIAVMAIAVDWGYAFAQRRAMSNAGQAAALAAGRLLAGSAVVGSSGSASFLKSEEDIYAEACSFAVRNVGSPAEPSTYSLTVEFMDSAGAAQSGSPIAATLASTTVTANVSAGASVAVAPASMTSITTGRVLIVDTGSVQEKVTVTATTGSTFTATYANAHSGTWKIRNCVNPTTTTTIPTATRDVRVTMNVTYPSIFGSVIGTSSITAAGSGRSRIGGAPVNTAATFNNGTPQAMVRHYDPSEFANTCGNPCNPTTATPVSFWGNQGSGSWQGLVDFSRYFSTAHANNTTTPQLFKSYDTSGAKTDKTSSNKPPACSGGTWDPQGSTSDSDNQTCSLPNWDYYGFRGTLCLTSSASTTDPCYGATNWGISVGSRPSICTSPPSYLYTPSCTTNTLGDWVQTNSGNGGSNIGSMLKSAIADFGTIDDFYSVSVPGGGSTTYGKKLVVMVYLWDCAQSYSNGSNTWSLINNQAGTDCSCWSSTTSSSSCTSFWQGNPSVDRVHLFTYAPFTFYYGLVNNSSAKGFWGGLFGSSDACPSSTSCSSLNVFSNTTWLVGD